MLLAAFKQQSGTLTAFCLLTLFVTARALLGDDADAPLLQSAERFAIQIGEPIVVPVDVFGDKY